MGKKTYPRAEPDRRFRNRVPIETVTDERDPHCESCGYPFDHDDYVTVITLLADDSPAFCGMSCARAWLARENLFRRQHGEPELGDAFTGQPVGYVRD